VIKQPVRYLVSSPFHDPFNGGGAVSADVFKVAHQNYCAGLVDQMQRGNVTADVQQARLPNATYRDRMTFYLGGKEIRVLHFGNAHTRGDSVLFVPQDRIVYMSEVFFNEEFPNMTGGYGVSWIRVLDAVRALDADIFIPEHGPFLVIRSRHAQRSTARDRSSWRRATESRMRLHAARPKIRRSRRSSSISTRSCMRSPASEKSFCGESTKN
jgi:glyoxylase-like metal-dependent hydrolase (beta-lactamase superfamily II)